MGRVKTGSDGYLRVEVQSVSDYNLSNNFNSHHQHSMRANPVNPIQPAESQRKSNLFRILRLYLSYIGGAKKAQHKLSSFQYKIDY